jgi:ornithine cyclodeaminase
MTPHMITRDVEPLLSWQDLANAIAAGHSLPRAEIADTFLYRGRDTMLNRAAWIDGLGSLVKTAMIMPDQVAAVQGGVMLFDDTTGKLNAVLDFGLVTKWKTVGDSVLAATRLARPDSRKILIVGAGTVGRGLWEAYGALFPGAEFTIWNRSPEGAARFARDCPGTTVAIDLEQAVAQADIITAATMTTEPILEGAWFRPGQHIDLIGAYRPDMREVDDATLTRARIFVDSRDTTMGHIGELKIPLAAGVIRDSDVLADYYDLPSGAFARQSDDEITLFKNGGGAHLDLMVATYILSVAG